MFSVEYHYQGQGLWTSGASPMTRQGAAAHAQNLRDLGFADEARVVPSEPTVKAPATQVDLRV